MNKRSIIISFAIVTFIFSACSWQTKEKKEVSRSSESLLIQKVETEQTLEKNVFLSMNVMEKNENTVKVQLFLENPSKRKLESVRSWISFPSDILEGTKIEFPTNAPYTLTAPGEEQFDNKDGLAKIGVSFDSDFVPEGIVPLATLHFDKLQNESAALSFFDARDEGHTQALMFHKRGLRNVLDEGKLEVLMVETEK